MSRIWVCFLFLGAYLWELTRSNVLLSLAVFSPRLPIKPGFVRYPMRVQHPLTQLLLANLITMTPGTVTLDMSDDQNFLFVHNIQVDDPDGFRKSLYESIEKWLMKIWS